MGSCTGKLTDKVTIKRKISNNTEEVTNESATKRLVPRKNIKQKAAVIDSRISDDTYSECPTAIIQDITKTEQEVRLIINSLKRHFIFSNLKQEYKSIIVHHMKHYFLNALEIIFEQNKPGNNFYVVATGKLEVFVNNKPVAQLKPGDSFGEMALIHDTPRTATIKTLEKSSLWVLDRKTFRKTLELLESVNYQENQQFIETISIFETLTSSQKEALVHAFSTLYFNPGVKILKEGEPGELLYIVKEGNVLCTKGDSEIRRLGKGAYFGEQALIYNEMRTATVTALDNVKCIAISGTKLSKVLGSQLQSLIYHNSIRIAIEKNHYLKKLSKEQIENLIENMKFKSFTDHSVVIPAGSLKANCMWIVIKGCLIKENSEVIARVFDIVGTESMIKNLEGVFENDIYADGASDLAFISQDEFTKLLGGNYAAVTEKNETLRVLKRIQIFRGLDNHILDKILEVMTVAEFQDENIVEQNSVGDAFFIVKFGTVEVVKADGSVLRQVTKNDYFGERSLIFNELRSATAFAKGKVACWKLLKSTFMELLEDNIKKQLLKRIELQDDTISLDDLSIVKLLGSGMFGNVFLTMHKTKGILYALKTIDRKKIYVYEIQENVALERKVLMQLDHIFIMKLVRTFKDNNRLYFLLEYINGIDLFEVIRKLNLLSESDARFYTCVIISILEHLHEREIIFRDLKPENIVVDDEGYPRLIDFGTAKFVHGRTYTIVGTPQYMAPEVINGNGYGLTADFWSVGIMLYEFLFGLVPFGEDEDEPYAVYQKIQERKLEFPAWLDQKSKAKELVLRLLSKNPAKRLGGSIENLKAHPFFAGFEWDKLLLKEIKSPYIPQVKSLLELSNTIKSDKTLQETILSVEDTEEIPQTRVKPYKIRENWDEEF